MDLGLSKVHACRDVRGDAAGRLTYVPKSNSRALIIAETPAGLKRLFLRQRGQGAVLAFTGESAMMIVFLRRPAFRPGREGSWNITI